MSGYVLAGPQGRQYYVVTLHSASPLDELEEVQAAATSTPSTGFQMPSGFVLKGAAQRGLTCTLAQIRHSQMCEVGRACVPLGIHLLCPCSIR